ncbi:hypothetical protein BDR07DRAFT_1384352 [Suillus spraguei]|nr:hypothetical protein BDR07DRAFT_1384352 [Suillus spraguei]
MPDDGEYIDIGNVSGDEEDNLPAPSVRAPPVPALCRPSLVPSTPPKSIPWLWVSEECSLKALQMSITSSGKIQLLNARLAESARWTLAAIHEKLQDPAYNIESLGTIPNQGHGNFLPGTTLSLDNYIPHFSIDEMHRQLVKLIVADDQAS